MATSAGKSMSYIAALLLVMDAMMASSANGVLVVTNNCTTVITLTVPTELILPIFSTDTSVTANPGATITEPLPIPLGFVKLVQIQIGAKVYVLPLSQITNVTGIFGLQQISIVTCSPPCEILVLFHAKINNKDVTTTCINA